MSVSALPTDTSSAVLRVATVGDLPTAANGAVKGDIRYVDADDEIYSFDGSTWQQVSIPSGTVVGPGSSTDNGIVRFDGTGGNTLQNSVVTISDTGVISGATIAVASVTGAVAGPASATDNAFARFDGTTGKLIQDSTMVLGDTGAAVLSNTAASIDIKDSTNPTTKRLILDPLQSIVSGVMIDMVQTVSGSPAGFRMKGLPSGANVAAGRMTWNHDTTAIARFDFQTTQTSATNAGGILVGSLAEHNTAGGLFPSMLINQLTRNTGWGFGAIRSASTTGLDNTGVGNLAGRSIISTGSGASGGNRNSAFGSAALWTGVTNQLTGDDNTGVGWQAGNTVQSGSQNTFVGSDADATSSSISNATAIGYGASVSASNTVVLGNTSVTSVKTTGVIESTVGGFKFPDATTQTTAATAAAIGGTLTSATAGSILFAGSGTFAQDNANFFWDDSANRLGIGTITPNEALEVSGKIRAGSSDYVLLDSTLPGIDLFKSGSHGTRITSTAGKTFVLNDFGNTGQDFFKIDVSNVMHIDKISSGGINGSTFSALAIVGNLYGISTSTPAISLRTFDTSGSTDQFHKLDIYNGDDGKIILQPNGTGNVGIGDTAPAEKLTVAGNIAMSVAGNGLYIKEGADATMGLATMAAGTVTVSTTKVTANSRIFYSINDNNTTAAPGVMWISARTAGTSFTIVSSNGADDSKLAWMIVEPA